jgi:hypothetical protein
MAGTLLAALKWLVPSWLNDEITQSLVTVIDEHTARARAGLEARMPSRAGDDALLLIGQDRRIPRGRTETREHYISRLLGWRYPFGHRVRGSAYGLLDQIRQYWSGGETTSMYCATIDAKLQRFAIQASGALTYDHEPWNWDGATNKGRFWVVLRTIPGVSPGPLIGDPALWDGTVGPDGRGYTIGQYGVTPEDIAAMRELVLGATPWKPAGTRAEHVVLVFDNTFPVPTGNWQTQINRDPAFRYWSLLR